MSHDGNRLHLCPPIADGPEARPLSERDDDELLLLSRAGRMAAFDEIVRRHQARVLCVAGKYLRSPVAARDAAQSAFLEVYRSLPRYKAKGRFGSYLYRVLVNQCRMVQRSTRYEKHALATLSVAPAESPALAEAQILAREQRREMEAALGHLSKKLQDVVVLRYGGDLSYQEIADTLEIPLGTVKRRLFDGLEKLRQLVEHE